MREQITPSNLLPEMRLVNPAFTADFLGTTEGTLAVWRCYKRYGLPFVKVGRKVLYRMSDLEKFIERRTCSGTSEATTSKRRGKAE